MPRLGALAVAPVRLLTKAYLLAYSAYIAARLGHCGRRARFHPPALLYSPEKMSVGDDVSIWAHAWLNCIPSSTNDVTLTIGNGCRIGRFCHINAYESVVLEEHVLLADGVHISDATHRHDDPDVPIMLQPQTFQAPVLLKRGAWIGAGAVILPGVTVGRNAIVGANAVVTASVPDDHVAVGVPARSRPRRA